MKIAFLGKGGSGKSTLAYRMCQHLSSDDFSVLAVDADHNMDLAYVLDPAFKGPFLGDAKEDVHAYSEGEKGFSLDPIDRFTEKYAKPIHSRMRLMVAGPHTEDVLEGKRCSHSLSSPLKRYFSRLKLADKEAVVVDEKAGSDGAGTGVLKGFDHAFVIVEPNPRSAKAADQIADILEYYAIPYSFVGNKVLPGSSLEPLGMRKQPVWSFPFSVSMAGQGRVSGKSEREGFEALVTAIR